MNPYRRLVSCRVRVDHTSGSSTGMLHSITPNSAWLLVNSVPGECDDLFIRLSDITSVEATS